MTNNHIGVFTLIKRESKKEIKDKKGNIGKKTYGFYKGDDNWYSADEAWCYLKAHDAHKDFVKLTLSDSHHYFYEISYFITQDDTYELIHNETLNWSNASRIMIQRQSKNKVRGKIECGSHSHGNWYPSDEAQHYASIEHARAAFLKLICSDSYRYLFRMTLHITHDNGYGLPMPT